MVVLDRLLKEHDFPLSLYSRIKKNLKYNFMKDVQCVSEFVEDLPLNLKQQLSCHIYESLYTQVDFLKSKSQTFISWICPILKTTVASPKEYIFYEGDEINRIYFVKGGKCDYVLPKYTNQPFITIVERTCFGVIDIVSACLDQLESDDKIVIPESNASYEDDPFYCLDRWFANGSFKLRRSFTARA